MRGFVLFALGAALGGTTLVTSPVVQAQSKGQTGVLKCSVAGGWGKLVGSKRSMTCIYEPTGSGQKHSYTGSLGRLGIDIGRSKKSVMIWAVVASNKGEGELSHDAIAGKYVGIGAQAAVVFGVGANALVGGSGKSIALQPLSVSGERGTNLAVGVQTLQLSYTGLHKS